METLDSLSHYEYEWCDNGYVFTTDSGNTYIVSFIDCSPLISEAVNSKVYSFVVERVNQGNHVNGSDNKVRNTILIILREFFKINTNALISVCEMNDGKQKARYRLFSSWEKKFLPSDIKKAHAAFCIDGVRTYAILYYHENNIDADILAQGFKVLIDVNFYND